MRLGYSTMGVHIKSNEVDHFFLIISRVTEHTSSYAMACLDHVLKNFENMDLYTQAMLFFDGCKQFKSLQVLGTVGKTYFEVHPRLLDTEVHVGCPKHFKSAEIDGLFGVKKGILADWTLRHELHTPQDVVKVANSHFRERDGIYGDGVKYLALYFEPPHKKDILGCRFTSESIFGLEKSFCWSFKRRRDFRRKSLCGKGLNKYEVTAVYAKNHGVSGAVAIHEGHPVWEDLFFFGGFIPFIRWFSFSAFVFSLLFISMGIACA